MPAKKKCTDEELIEKYEELKSVWKVGDHFGMCGQSVHERLKRLKIKLKGQNFIESECKLIKQCYENNSLRGDGKTKELAQILNREHTSIVRKARELGLTNANRNLNQKMKKNISHNNKKWHKEHEHPKGMLNKAHSDEYRIQIGKRTREWFLKASEEEKFNRYKKMIQTRRDNGNDKNHRGSWKASWRNIGGKKKFYRSRWEANYARCLEYMKKKGEILDWEHEPQTFWFEQIKRGSRSYLPDFKVINIDGSHYWVEVKGWMCPRSITKIKRFRKYYPNESLEIVDKEWFKINTNKYKPHCIGWE